MNDLYGLLELLISKNLLARKSVMKVLPGAVGLKITRK